MTDPTAAPWGPAEAAPWLALDLLLAGGMLALAALALGARDRFATVVLFIVFGAVVALAWARLAAPDVALAEASVGAGVTGALLLSAWRHMERRRAPRPAPAPAGAPGLGTLLAGGLAAGVTLALGAALLALPRPGPGLGAAVAEALPRSGVENPVTAVLLNLRAYDTLLEVAVLLAAVAVAWLGPARPAPRDPAFLGPLFLGFARLVLPALVVVAGYLLWIGAFAPGGAFQGGAVLASAGILALLGRLHAPAPAALPWTRLALALGLGVFTLAALLAAPLGGGILRYPEAEAKTWIIAIEAALTLSIGATLAALLLGGEPANTGPASAGPAVTGPGARPPRERAR